jgi:hypothetical protein
VLWAFPILLPSLFLKLIIRVFIKFHSKAKPKKIIAVFANVEDKEKEERGH